VRYEQQCPRCGAEFTGENKDEVVDAVIAHAQMHGHSLDWETILAHLEGVHPHERESD
jgi:predicted small metal-binding protein